METTAPEKKPIAPTLLKMNVGQVEKFEHIQCDGVDQGIGRLQRKFKKIGLKFSKRTTDEAIEVTRVA